jgi:hypothetical protein
VFQAGFIKGKRNTGIIFVIKTTIDIYFRFKRGRLYSCIVDFEEAFDSVLREALRYKLRRKGISDNMINWFKEMYTEQIKFCMKC